MSLKATIVFQKNWDAIHELNEDGTRKYRYIINKGSSRSSKTISIIDVYDLYARSNSNKRLTVWRDTKTDCKKTVLNDALKHHKRTNRYLNGYIFNKTESIFHYDNDSTVEIHGTDDEETVHGLTQDAAWLNEPYKISKDTFDQIDQRTSDFIIIDLNPKKDHWSDDIAKDPRTLVIHSTFKDNPFCPIEQKRKILSYQPVILTEVVLKKLIAHNDALTYDAEENALNFTDKQINELTRCILNEFKNSADAFKWEVYGLGNKAERPNRIFRWTSIPWAEYSLIDAPIVYGVDWGVVDPMGVLEVKYYDGALYLHELNYKSENQIREGLSDDDRRDIREYVDEGLIMWFFTNLGVSRESLIVCDNNRPHKIIALRKAGFEGAVSATKGAGSIIDGIDLLSNMDIYYTSSSVNIAYEQENYSRKVDRYGKVLEEPEDRDNHLTDPTRYVAAKLREMGLINVI